MPYGMFSSAMRLEFHSIRMPRSAQPDGDGPGDGLVIVWFVAELNGSGDRAKWFDSSRSVDKLLQIGVIFTPQRHVPRPVGRA